MHEPTDRLRERAGGAADASWTAALVRYCRTSERQADLRRALIIGLGAGVFLGLVGPFGMHQIVIGIRVAYWISAIMAGTVVGIATATLLGAAFDRDGRRPFLMAAVTTAAMTPLASLAVFGVTRLFFPEAQFFPTVPALIGPVFVISAGMTTVNALAAPKVADREPVSPVVQPAVQVRFFERLSPKLRGAELYAIEAEDHYLRIHTARGSDLILMRLADAIAELEGLEGAQTHRSWWVARAAVREARRGDGRATLVLISGVEAPVSRTYAPDLKARGWY